MTKGDKFNGLAGFCGLVGFIVLITILIIMDKADDNRQFSSPSSEARPAMDSQSRSDFIIPTIEEIQKWVGCEKIDGIIGPETIEKWDRALCNQAAQKWDYYYENNEPNYKAVPEAE